ncbi:MAG: hypothetical protein JXO22_18260, partial [Phycisphaerae bacterium]|nr:hypothetical protein [Phycisphaerae bacterium]
MTGSRGPAPAQHIRIAMLLILCVTHTGQLQAQPDVEHTRTRIPLDNEAALLVEQLADAVNRDEPRRAIGLADQLFARSSGLVQTRAGGTFMPAADLAARMLADLSPDGVALYRQLHDSETEALFTAATDCGDLAALECLFVQRRLSTCWAAVGFELSTRLLEQADYGGALDVCDTLLNAGAEPRWILEGQRIVALARLGAAAAARDTLARCTSDAAMMSGRETRRLFERLSTWLDGAASGASGGAVPGILPAIPWQYEL